jgi:hypothetical protein
MLGRHISLPQAGAVTAEVERLVSTHLATGSLAAMSLAAIYLAVMSLVVMS